ncbi:DUF4365 domain-containing protein [Gaetbulibacter jejuensis]|uniref:DUF4365 domain-containing protein n=1 Tax=Gaetbulibacter jejuensis TaxID=584607 RepID=UPI00300A87AA
MVKYSNSNIVSKEGVNFIKSVVENSGSIFHKIDQENDLGIDGIIEFIDNGKPSHKSIAVQIKSGNSFYNEKSKTCKIQIGNHYEYWLNYFLPVCGLVYIPKLKNAYWVNIKSFLENNQGATSIRFVANRSNCLNLINFKKLFYPNIHGKIPDLILSEALSLFDSKVLDEFRLGRLVLFNKYVNEQLTWQRFINHIISETQENIDLKVVYNIAHIPWHPDIFYSGDVIKNEIKEYVAEEINKFGEGEIIKLLSLINEDIGIQRGTIGQSIDAILSLIKNINQHLESIILNKSNSEFIGNISVTLYAYYKQEESVPFLSQISNNDYVNHVLSYLNEYKGFYIYQ